MKIQEVFFVISIFGVGVQAANFYSLVDTQNDEITLEEPDEVVNIPMTLDIVTDDAVVQQGSDVNTGELLIDQDMEANEEKQKNSIESKKVVMKAELELLKLQNQAILKKFNEIEEKNRILQEKLAVKINKHHKTSQKPARVHLEENSQDSDENVNFWDWLCMVAKNVARGFLNFFGIHF